MALVQGYRKLGAGSLGFANVWTIQWWAKIVAKGTVMVPWQIRDSTGAGKSDILPLITAADEFKIQLNEQNGQPLITEAYGDLMFPEDDFVFVQIVITWNALNAVGDRLRVFRNGDRQVPDYCNTGSTVDITMTDIARDISVGMNTAGTFASKQDLHSFAIWDTDLTEETIKKIYNGGSACTFDLQVNSENYQQEASLQHWWRFGGAGLELNAAQAEDVSTYGQDTEGVASPLINLSDDQLCITPDNLIGDAPCGVEPNILAITTGSSNQGLENFWITLPFTDVTSGFVEIPQVRAMQSIDFRMWAVGPGNVKSEESASFSQVPIEEGGNTSTPTGFKATTGLKFEDQGVRHTIQFSWDPPPLEDDVQGYVLKYHLVGPTNDPWITASIVYASNGPVFQAIEPPAGDYEATLASIDGNGAQSAVVDLDFTFDPVMDIAPLKVRNLQQCDNAGDNEVKGDSFCIEWRRSVNTEDIGFSGPFSVVPILKDYEVEVFNFIDNTKAPTVDNLNFRGIFHTTENKFVYDIGINTMQSNRNTALGLKAPDRKLFFTVRMRDVQEGLSDKENITLQNTVPDAIIVGGFVAAGPRTLSFKWKRADDADDPDFRGVIVWAIQADNPTFTPTGSKVGEGNVVAQSNQSPITWDADPTKVFTVKAAAFDAFPIIPADLNVVDAS